MMLLNLNMFDCSEQPLHNPFLVLYSAELACLNDLACGMKEGESSFLLFYIAILM